MGPTSVRCTSGGWRGFARRSSPTAVSGQPPPESHNLNLSSFGPPPLSGDDNSNSRVRGWQGLPGFWLLGFWLFGFRFLGTTRRHARRLAGHLRVDRWPRCVLQPGLLIAAHHLEERFERLRVSRSSSPTASPCSPTQAGTVAIVMSCGRSVGSSVPRERERRPARDRGRVPTTGRTRSCAGRSG